MYQGLSRTCTGIVLLGLLFSDVHVAVAVVGFLNSLMACDSHVTSRLFSSRVTPAESFFATRTTLYKVMVSERLENYK